ncbi:MAG: prolyl oligopeptidase family serine peptidase [Simkaniaceae bacterium]
MNKKSFLEWISPVTAEMLAKSSLRLGPLLVDSKEIYWIEGRPEEKGRCALIQNGHDLLPKFSIRSSVHEYGGAAFTVKNKVVAFINASDQNLYLFNKGEILQVTNDQNRYANPLLTNDAIYAIAESHDETIKNFIVRIDRTTFKASTLIEGADFYGSLTISPDESSLAFIQWNHPHMPWDESEGILYDLSKNHLIKVAGGKNESICLPKFSPDGELYFVTDKNGYWNLSKKEGLLFEMEAEFGEPLWVLGGSRYDFWNEKIVASFTKNGCDFLSLIDDQFHLIDLPFTRIRNLHVIGDDIVFYGAMIDQPDSLYRLNLKSYDYQTLQSSTPLKLSQSSISVPQEISFPTSGNQIAHGFLYMPKNEDFEPLEMEKPPLIVRCHGGPSGNYFPAFDFMIQYWTTRGYALFDINYRGSTGYGRDYREQLAKNWGIIDVIDVVNGAKYLTEKGLVDGEKMVIRGSSAGGFTALSALTFYEVFKGGTSLYGVSDLEALQKQTHKFEAFYNDKLIGSYPENRSLYQKRSPINNLDKIKTPILFLQGDRDLIVPPEQSEALFTALKNKGISAEFTLYEGEGHGFRKSETIKQAIESETRFYLKIFNYS